MDGSAQPLADEYIAPVPRISVQAFCESQTTFDIAKTASQDRRLAKAHMTVKMGGVAAAVETYHSMPTPNVIILESAGRDILDGLDELASVCDPGTRVVVIGSEKDEVAYRELVRRGGGRNLSFDADTERDHPGIGRPRHSRRAR